MAIKNTVLDDIEVIQLLIWYKQGYVRRLPQGRLPRRRSLNGGYAKDERRESAPKRVGLGNSGGNAVMEQTGRPMDGPEKMKDSHQKAVFTMNR